MNTPQTFAVTFFTNFAAQQKRERRNTFSALAGRIATTTAASKTLLPWLKLARFGDQRTEHGSLRHDANVLACTGVEGDYDGGRVVFAAALELLQKAGIAAIAYTSPSYTPEFPKWRVLCPFSEELPPAKRAHMLGRVAGLFAISGVEFSTESWTLSQSYYYGSVNQNPGHRVEVIDGMPIDQHDELDAIRRSKPNTTATGHLDEAALYETLIRICSNCQTRGHLSSSAALLLPPATY
jgi:hypothetical protein